MTDDPSFTLGVAAIAFVLMGNVYATRLVLRDQDSERRQKTLQLLFVWLIPVIGAVIVFGVHRAGEKASGKYRDPPEPGDEYRDPARAASNRARAEIDPAD